MIEQKSFDDKHEFGNLYLVPTPIGNLDDITYRAVKTLQEVDLIAAEDTRHTGLLLSHLEIKNKLTSLHEHNYAAKVPQLIELLKNGQNIAQVSDAGTPSISDPGQQLVQAAIEQNINVISLPGASAGITALIDSGLSTQPFTFMGFLPRKNNEQIKLLTEWMTINTTLLIYESPFRIFDTLVNVQKVYGQDVKVVVARELTKKFETYIRGEVKEVIEFIEKRPPKGEIVLLIEVPESEKKTASVEDMLLEVIEQIDDGLKPNEAIKKTAKKYDFSRNELYDLYNRK